MFSAALTLLSGERSTIARERSEATPLAVPTRTAIASPSTPETNSSTRRTTPSASVMPVAVAALSVGGSGPSCDSLMLKAFRMYCAGETTTPVAATVEAVTRAEASGMPDEMVTRAISTNDAPTATCAGTSLTSSIDDASDSMLISRNVASELSEPGTSSAAPTRVETAVCSHVNAGKPTVVTHTGGTPSVDSAKMPVVVGCLTRQSPAYASADASGTDTPPTT